MRLYNTLSARKEEFRPLGGAVKMYVCGVTPYAETHVGHAMSYVVFDVLRRYLEYRGYQVHHVQNVTDIDDKIIQRGHELGEDPLALAERHAADYLEDMDGLNLQRAHQYPRATQEVPRILEMIAGLVEKGYAYASHGDVYFRVRCAPDYGKLSHRTLEGMQAGARVELAPHKEHPMDFVLWKGAKPGEPSWESPWGPGRPGWHIECSAMSLAYLGETVDIHGGGADLVFPHHENEIAQSEAFTGVQPFVRWWVHNGLLQLGESKMSKSLGNLVPVRQALQTYTPDALRLFFLGSHYRNPLVYNEEGLASQERAAERLRRAFRTPDNGAGAPLEAGPYVERFEEAMDDDLNTPQALAILFDLARDINRAREEGRDTSQARAALGRLAGVLGLTLRGRGVEDRLVAQPFIELLVETRDQLRAARQFELADQIRRSLGELGVVLEDTSRGTEWTFKGPGPASP